MADLFTRLVGRTLELAPTLQPRPASIYTPQQGTVSNGATVQTGATWGAEIQELEPSGTRDDRSQQEKKLQPLVSSDLVSSNSAMAMTRLPSSLLFSSQSPEQVLPSNIPDVLDSVSSEVQIQSFNESTLDTNLETSQNLVISSAITPVQHSSSKSPQDQISNPEQSNLQSAIFISSEVIPRSSTNENAESSTQELSAAVLASPAQLTPAIAQPSLSQVRELSTNNDPVSPNRLSVSQPLETQEHRPTATNLERSQDNQQGSAIAKLTPLVSPASPSPATQIEGRPAIKPIVQPEVRGVSTSAPTIQVTIGRIEVRAVTSAAPSPRPRSTPSTPQLSLQDYLKARNGGNG